MVADFVLWLQMWSYGCRCGPIVAYVVLWLQLWSYGCSCASMFAAVVLWLQVWSYGCSCGSMFAAVILWLQQVMWSQHSSYGSSSPVGLCQSAGEHMYRCLQVTLGVS